MSGNVYEWVDSCSPYQGLPFDNCSLMGGSFTVGDVPCLKVTGGSNNDIPSNEVGFRCCADVP
jgi:hypothetical protein